jgi:glycerol-3-phosphate acyltransferase PlsY
MADFLSISALLALLLGYLLGSIPFGLLLSRAAGLGDIRAIGSGNIGATNVLRTGRKDLAAATLVFDALKGTVAVLLGALLSPAGSLAAGLGAFLGHILPAWLAFKGGKGVATYIGVLAALFWPAALAFCAIWLAVAYVTRYSSLSALTASAFTPVFLWLLGQSETAVLFVALTALLFFKHSANIQRLLSGRESKIGVTS